jgi:prophage regulatory protein
MKPLKIYRMPDIFSTTGLKSSTIYKLVRNKEFPPPIKLTSRSSGWLSHDVDRWLESRLDQGMPKTDQTRAVEQGRPQRPDSISPLQRRVEK